jgi:acetyl-CoA carboxylase carboxyltransferase component
MWAEEITELAHRRARAAELGGAEPVERQRAKGKLTVRDRIARLVDAGSWRELGELAGRSTYAEDGGVIEFRATNTVLGRARVGGVPAVVVGDDFTVRGGAADPVGSAKQVHAEQMAGEAGVPLIRLLDGTGGGGTVESLLDMGRTYVPWNPGWDEVVANLGRIPVIAVALGPVAGLGAARLVTSHLSIMVRGLSQVFIAGPAVVAAGMGEQVDKEALGGWRATARAGTVDLVVDSEDEALALARRLLSYLPPRVGAPLPRGEPAAAAADPDPALRDVVPRDRRQPYDMRAILDRIFDPASVLELGRYFAPSTITALARLDGWPVAVLASDPRVYGGGLTAEGSDKMTRFVDLAETFGLPVVHLVDQPGFVIGSAAERAGTIRRGARAVAAIYETTVPWASVLIRRVFGVAGAAHRPHHRYTFRVAWPSGDWGSLPVEGGVEVAFQRRFAAAGEDAERMRAEILAKLEAVRSPMRTAEAFGIEDIIDPADTRPLLCEWVNAAVDAPRYGTGGRGRARP